MRKIKPTALFSILLLSIGLIINSCGADEIYDQEMSLEISNGYGHRQYKWVFKYPKSLSYAKDFKNKKEIEGGYFVDTDILRTLANDPEGWGYGCYCAFKTLTDSNLLVNRYRDYVETPAIMLRRLEAECFPNWLDEAYESKIYEIQQAATERILSKSGYEVTDWEAEKPTVINGLNVYVYEYNAKKMGVETKHKVACLIKDKYAIELSVRASSDEYGKFRAKFDKILATAEFKVIEDKDENSNNE